MRIVSVNAWGGALLADLLAWLPAVGADVLCLQEVTRTPLRSGWAQFDGSDQSPGQRENLLDDVRRVLPTHESIFVAAESTPVLPGSTQRREFGIATFVAADTPVIGLRTRFVHGGYTDYPEFGSEARPRVALATTVRDRVANRTVTIIHLHGLRIRAGKHDTAERLDQARRLAELVERCRADSDLIVVGGDLNLLPDSATFAILAEVGLTDLVGTIDTRTSHYPKPVRHADYLLVSDPDAVKRFEVVATPEVSDHRALLLDI